MNDLDVSTQRCLVAKEEGRIEYGWEVTDENGDVVDMKYGYAHFTQAARDGQRARARLERIAKVA